MGQNAGQREYRRRRSNRLLSLPVPKKNIPKDAAKAVKRVGDLNIQTVRAETLSELLGLVGMRVTHFAIEEDNGKQNSHLFCEHEHAVGICPCCQMISAELHEETERCVRHLDLCGMRVWVHFPQRRFGCEKCNKPFSENLEWVDPKRRHTNPFELHIYEQVKNKMPRKQVAIEAGLHEATVPDIFKRQAKRTMRPVDNRKVRVLGVDEISLRKGHKQYALVLSDLVRRCVIAVLPNRLKQTCEAWPWPLVSAV